MKKIGLIVGTRPEVIKMAPVYWALQAYPIEIKVIFSGQHCSLIGKLFAEFEMVVDYELSVMTPGQSLNSLFVKVMDGIDSLLEKELFDLILVHGDTTTAGASAVACFNRGLNIAHVEAGLRTGNPFRPFPEEMNRSLIARVASLHFCPTPLSCSNLLSEGISREAIHIVGNTVVDALDMVGEKLRGNCWDLMTYCKSDSDLCDFLTAADKELVLVTLHRRENIEHLPQICEALKTLSSINTRLFIVLPVHSNPEVSSSIRESLNSTGRIFLIDPPDYIEFAPLMKRSSLIITDSGGVQEEAFVLGKPLLILRESTERPEVLASSQSELIEDQFSGIPQHASRLLKAKRSDSSGGEGRKILGGGAAAKRIAAICADFV